MTAPTIVLAILAAAALGAVVAWLVARAQTRAELAAAETGAEGTRTAPGNEQSPSLPATA